MKRIFWLIIFFIFLSFLNSTKVDFQEYKIKLLPPEKLESDGIIYEIKPSYDEKFFAFDLTIENQSMEIFVLNISKDITLNEKYPNIVSLRSEIIKVMPNEKYTKKIVFNRKNFQDGKQYLLKINDVTFFLKYYQTSKLVKRALKNKASFVDYCDKDNIVFKQKNSNQFVFKNSSGKNIVNLFLIEGDEKVEFKQQDFLHWLGEVSPSFNFQKGYLLVKHSKNDPYLVVWLSALSDQKKELKKEKVVRPDDQYQLSVVPLEIARGKRARIQLYIKYHPKIERISGTVFGEAFQMEKFSEYLWQKDIKIPNNIDLGEYLLKIFIRDKKGVVVLTEDLKVL